MKSVWIKRTFRLWLVTLLPLAIYCAYQARSLDRIATDSQALANTWLERELKHERDGTKGTFDPRAARTEALTLTSEVIEKRDNYTRAGVLLLTLPLFALVVFGVLRWSWGPGSRPESIQAASTAGRLQSATWYRRPVVIAGALGAALLVWLSPTRTASVFISTLVQLAGLGIVLWLVSSRVLKN